MIENIFRLTRRPTLSIPVEDADKLLSGADGLSALLYLYILRKDGTVTVSEASEELGRSEREIAESLERMTALGLLGELAQNGAVSESAEPARSGDLSEPVAPVVPTGEFPDYDAEELSRHSQSDEMFQFIVSETQRVFGRLLSVTELKAMLAFYAHLALPCEVILTLINYCVGEARERHGEGRLPTIRQIEQEARIWADREILTIELADEYMRYQFGKKDSTAKIKRVLQISGRELSSSEKKYVDGWIEMGFSEEAIEIAYDRTIIKTGKLTWKYMDTIFVSWHGRGLHTPQEILDGDGQRGFSRSETTVNREVVSQDQAGEIERLKKILNKVSSS